MQQIKIKSIKRIPITDRYDLTVNSTKNFFANGILIHNTSGISSNVLVKRKLTLLERIAKKIGVKVIETKYDESGLYSSRKVIQNSNPNVIKHKKGYRELAHDKIFPLLSKGMTAYYEIVGYTENGAMIQKCFDYGYTAPANNETYQLDTHFGIAVYRLTYTNSVGQVLELTAQQVQKWCEINGINSVKELFYGKAYEIYPMNCTNPTESDIYTWREGLIEELKKYWLKQCKYCKNKVPNEGIVLRKEGLGLEVYKFKNPLFLQFETKQLDSGETNIEDES